MPLTASATNTSTFLISSTKLADKLNDRLRAKKLDYRAVEIDCAATHAGAQCRYDIGGVVVLTTVAAAPGGLIWNVVAAYEVRKANTAHGRSAAQRAAIAIYTVLMEVLSPGSGLRGRSVALANLISNFSSSKQGAVEELDGVEYQMMAASATEVWLIATPTKDRR